MFNDAKFGDKFLTRDRRLAIYHYKEYVPSGKDYPSVCTNLPLTVWHNLIVENEPSHIICTDNGLNVGSNGSWGEDIVKSL